MKEIDILDLFYNAMKTRGVTREDVFLNIDNAAAEVLSQNLGVPVPLSDAKKMTDICIANEWIERTTVDPGYKP